MFTLSGKMFYIVHMCGWSSDDGDTGAAGRTLTSAALSFCLVTLYLLSVNLHRVILLAYLTLIEWDFR